jgi:hypothetical protein
MQNAPRLVYNTQMTTFNLLISLNQKYINVVSKPLINFSKCTFSQINSIF